MEKVIQKLIECVGGSSDCIEAHMTLVEEILPEWLKKVNVRHTYYIKVDRKIQLNDIMTRIDEVKGTV